MPQIKLVHVKDSSSSLLCLDVETLSRQGWEIQEIREIESPVFGTQVVPPSNPGGYSQTFAGNVDVVRSLVFVMRLNDESALAKLNADLELAKAAARDAEKSREEAGTKIDTLARDLENALNEKERVAGQLTTSTERCTALRSSVDKLERDIAKIRNELGDAKMRAILSAEEKK